MAGGQDPAGRGRAGVMETLLASIRAKKAALDQPGPVSGDALRHMQKYNDIELIYTSNAIEGNTLTHRETAELIEHGITVGGKTLKGTRHRKTPDPAPARHTSRGIRPDPCSFFSGKCVSCAPLAVRPGTGTSPRSSRKERRIFLKRINTDEDRDGPCLGKHHSVARKTGRRLILPLIPDACSSVLPPPAVPASPGAGSPGSARHGAGH